jgi:hypothetical protein
VPLGEGLLVQLVAEPGDDPPQLRRGHVRCDLGGALVEPGAGAGRQGGGGRADDLARVPQQPAVGQQRAGAREVLDEQPGVLEDRLRGPLGQAELDRELGAETRECASLRESDLPRANASGTVTAER